MDCKKFRKHHIAKDTRKLGALKQLKACNDLLFLAYFLRGKRGAIFVLGV